MNEENNENKDSMVDPFLLSVDKVKSSDIIPAVSKEKKGVSMYNIIRFGLFAFFLTVFIVSVCILVNRVSDYNKSDDLYDQMADLFNSDGASFANPFGEVAYSNKDSMFSCTPDYESAQTIEESSGNVIQQGSVDSPEMVAIKAKLNALKLQNQDLVGWIQINNTIIDYPVVLGDDNFYYLSHSFDHSYALSGTIFVDYRNSGDLDENYNTIIYGHNLAIGTMFSDLDKYFKKSFFNENRNVYVYTEKGIYVYEIFNVSKVSISLDYIKTVFKDPNEFVDFAYDMKSHSLYKTDTQFTGNDKILTLSTCTNAHNAAERYCVQAKLVEIRK